ncbi:MAG: carboxypeptidase-like regulatory domain-containing protein [Candidatus Omnitrophica bacterium]|nr:carboxypeptidase-like regulatory domain-containing protein [Candidatus Omnitrophota bacterium]
MIKRSLILAVSLVLILGGVASAADDDSASSTEGVIEGVVYHEEGSFLADANVVLDEGVQQVRTGLDGRFRMEGVTPGDHHLMCWREGYFDLGKEATVTVGGTTTVDFPLLKRIARK